MQQSKLSPVKANVCLLAGIIVGGIVAFQWSAYLEAIWVIFVLSLISLFYLIIFNRQKLFFLPLQQVVIFILGFVVIYHHVLPLATVSIDQPQPIFHQNIWVFGQVTQHRVQKRDGFDGKEVLSVVFYLELMDADDLEERYDLQGDLAHQIMQLPVCEEGRISICRLHAKQMRQKARFKVYIHQDCHKHEQNAFSFDQLKPGQNIMFQAQLVPLRAHFNPFVRSQAARLYANKVHQFGRPINCYYFSMDLKNQQSLFRQASLMLGAFQYDFQAYIRSKLTHSEYQATLQALMLGEKYFTPDQWHRLKVTGTSHLLVISGLHLGLIFVVAFYFFRKLVSSLLYLKPEFPMLQLSVVASLLVTWLFAYFTGWQVSAQRALWMAILFWLGQFTLQLDWFFRVAWTMLLILWLDPFQLINPGFWFSFIATFVILIWYQHKPKLMTKNEGTRVKLGVYCYQLAYLQILLSICLVPLQLYWGMSWNFIVPLANLFAVPWVSFILLPIVLILFFLCLLHFSFQSLLDLSFIIDFFILLADGCCHFLWSWLFDMEAFNLPDIKVGEYDVWQGLFPFFNTQHWLAIFLASIGLLTLLMKLPTKITLFLGVFGIVLSYLQTQSDCDDQSMLEMVVFDVGQGMAILLSVGQYNLLFDTGQAWGKYRIFHSTVEPLLKQILPKDQQGQFLLNSLVISHWDQDHSGAANYLSNEQSYKIGQKLRPFHEVKNTTQFDRHGRDWQACEQKSYHIQQVEFIFLSASAFADAQYERNHYSCILLVSDGDTLIILPGDIGQEREYEVIYSLLNLKEHNLYFLEKGQARTWQAWVLKHVNRVMLAPHHGSLSSSSQSWLWFWQPTDVIFSRGLTNRFHHPHPLVVQRYCQIGSRVFDTATHGAVWLYTNKQKSTYKLVGLRPRHNNRLWHPETFVCSVNAPKA